MGGRFSKRNRSLSRQRSVASSGEGRTGSSRHHHNPVSAAISRLPSMTSTSHGPNLGGGGGGGKSSTKKKYAFIPDNYHTLEEVSFLLSLSISLCVKVIYMKFLLNKKLKLRTYSSLIFCWVYLVFNGYEKLGFISYQLCEILTFLSIYFKVKGKYGGRWLQNPKVNI